MQDLRFSVYNHTLVYREDQLLRRQLIVLKDADGDIRRWTDFHRYARSGRKSMPRSITSGQDKRCTRVCSFLNYIESMNESEAENEYNDLVTYRTIDAQAFIEHNKTVPRMKEALVNRDRYYSKIASKAVRAIKEKNECLRKIEELEDRIRELEQTIEEMTAAAEKMKKSTDGSELQEKDMLIIKLRGILDDYIYPDMANAILKKEKILEAVNSVVSDESAAKNMMPAGDSINEQKPEKKKSRFGSVDSLMSGFDEE